MPELPEIKAHAERLDTALSGSTLTAFAPLAFTALKTHTPSPDDAVGEPLVRVVHRGKYLLLQFEPVSFVVHLMQGGRLKPDEKQAARPRGGLARWTFDDNRALLLTEAGTDKRAGVWVVAGEPEDREPLIGLGPDADRVDAGELAGLVSANPMRLHNFLRDQSVLAGIGRRLANEICHRARLSPFANTAKLGDDERGRLLDAIRSSTADSYEYERHRSDMSSSKQRLGEVHHRIGEACPVCGDTVRAVEYSAYTIAYCPTCQTGGRILADNTTSKFLK